MIDKLITFTEVAVVPIVVALIGALGVWMNRQGEARSRVLRDENTAQHAEGRALLEHLSIQVGGIDHKVDRLDTRLDGVQLWQVEHEKDHLRDTTPL